MATRNSFIISRGFRNYFIFSILFSVAEQLCATVDMILVGNFVGPDAFAALNLVIPVENLATGFLMLFTGGAGIIASRLIGDQDFNRAYKALTASTILSTAVAAAASIICLASLDPIVRVLCSDPSLTQYLTDYLKVYFTGLVPICLFFQTTLILNIDGKPQFSLVTMLAACVLDLLLDLLLMGYLGMGVKGLGIATIASYILPLVILIPYINHKCSFRYIWAGEDTTELLSQNIKFGIPYCLPYAVSCLITFIANTLILNNLGNEILYVWSTGYQVFSIVIMAMSCIGGTILVIMGSMLVGCHDMDGLKILTKKCMTVTALVVGGLVLIVLVFPHFILSIFGDKEVESVENADTWIRCIAISCIPYAVCCIKVYLSQALDRSFSSVLSLMVLLTLDIAALCIFVWADPARMYLALPLAGATFIIADFIICRIITLRRKDLSRYLLIPHQDDVKSKYISIPYNQAGMDNAIRELSSFLESCEMSPVLCSGVNLCCEEIMLSIIQNNAENKGEGYFFDISVLDDENEVKVTVKDAGFPFNPVRKYTKSAAEAFESGEDPDLSLRIVNQMCKELTYNYMYGQNTIYMSFVKNDGKKA